MFEESALLCHLSRLYLLTWLSHPEQRIELEMQLTQAGTHPHTYVQEETQIQHMEKKFKGERTRPSKQCEFCICSDNLLISQGCQGGSIGRVVQVVQKVQVVRVVR